MNSCMRVSRLTVLGVTSGFDSFLDLRVNDILSVFFNYAFWGVMPPCSGQILAVTNPFSLQMTVFWRPLKATPLLRAPRWDSHICRFFMRAMRSLLNLCFSSFWAGLWIFSLFSLNYPCTANGFECIGNLLGTGGSYNSEIYFTGDFYLVIFVGKYAYFFSVVFYRFSSLYAGFNFSEGGFSECYVDRANSVSDCLFRLRKLLWILIFSCECFRQDFVSPVGLWNMSDSESFIALSFKVLSYPYALLSRSE